MLLGQHTKQKAGKLNEFHLCCYFIHFGNIMHDLFSIVVTNHIGYKNKILKFKNFEHTCNFSPNNCKITWYKSQFHLHVISKLLPIHCFTDHCTTVITKSLIQIQTEKKSEIKYFGGKKSLLYLLIFESFYTNFQDPSVQVNIFLKKGK